jgi:hypothetical protein
MRENLFIHLSHRRSLDMKWFVSLSIPHKVRIYQEYHRDNFVRLHRKCDAFLYVDITSLLTSKAFPVSASVLHPGLYSEILHPRRTSKLREMPQALQKKYPALKNIPPHFFVGYTCSFLNPDLQHWSMLTDSCHVLTSRMSLCFRMRR